MNLVMFDRMVTILRKQDKLFYTGKITDTKHILKVYSSIPANGIFLTEKLKKENKNAQRVEND